MHIYRHTYIIYVYPYIQKCPYIPLIFPSKSVLLTVPHDEDEIRRSCFQGCARTAVTDEDEGYGLYSVIISDRKSHIPDNNDHVFKFIYMCRENV
jgi:hypothetical protein